MRVSTDVTIGDWEAAKPFPHCVCDDIIPQDIARLAAMSVPRRSDPRWKTHRDKTDRAAVPKMSISDPMKLPAPLREILNFMAGDEVTFWLRRLTGIGDLKPDLGFKGGGLHCLPRGGKLNMHVDFNRKARLFRAVNVFVYLNQEIGLGGELVLTPEQDTNLTYPDAAMIEPMMGRFVAFRYGEGAWHGNPVPYRGDQRLSLACYIYTAQQPTDFESEHSTIYAGK